VWEFTHHRTPTKGYGSTDAIRFQIFREDNYEFGAYESEDTKRGYDEAVEVQRNSLEGEEDFA
jgi:predicted kinase